MARILPHIDTHLPPRLSDNSIIGYTERPSAELTTKPEP